MMWKCCFEYFGNTMMNIQSSIQHSIFHLIKVATVQITLANHQITSPQYSDGCIVHIIFKLVTQE